MRQAYIQAPWWGKPVYMHPPEGWKNGSKVLAIDRAIYGLAESGLAWYKELKRFLTSEEGGSLIPSDADPCLFSNAAKTLHAAATRMLSLLAAGPDGKTAQALGRACVVPSSIDGPLSGAFGHAALPAVPRVLVPTPSI